MTRLRYALALAAFALTVGTGAGVARAAAPGTLDPSFGGGVVSPSGAAQFFGVTVQSNGSVLAAGQSDGGAALVERLTSAGAADASFGSGGQATGVAGVARAVALQPDGKIVVAGTSGGMFVERFNANGTVDSTFGSGGVARVFGGSGAANGVAVQPDGKIVVVGSINPIDTRVALARFNPNGTLDTSFGSGGSEVLAVFNLPYEAATAVAIQPDGKIVFTGYEQGSPNFAFFNGLVVRLNSDGSYDPSFNGNGVVSYHKAASGYDTMNAVTIQNDSKIVAAGSDVGGPYAIFLRINPNGSYDTGFGTGGEAALSSGNSGSVPYGAYGVGIAGGGRVAGAGAVLLNGADHRAGVWAVSASGQPQSDFGSNGVVEQQTGVEACGFAVAPDGGLIVVGHHVSPVQSGNPCTGSGGSSAFVARYVGYGPPPPPTPPVTPPTVSTGSATGVTEVSANVGGQVNPNGANTTYLFQYGTSTTYGSNTSPGALAAARTEVPVSVTITGLAPDTTYHYRIEATNSAGTRDGQDQTFTTAAAKAPKATTGGAVPTEISATVSGTVETNGLATTYHVEYGKSTSYGSSSSTATAAAGSSPASVSAALKGLRPGTTYHYRLVASSSGGISFGADRTFQTLPSLRSSVKKVATSYKIGTFVTTGISIKVGCNQPCSIKSSLLISASLAKRLKLGPRQLSIANGSSSLRRGGTASVVLRLTKSAKNTIAKQRSLQVTLQVVSSPVGGGRRVTFKQTVTLQR